MRHAAIPCLVLVVLVAGAAAQKGYYREPALGPGVLVFASEGDLWSVGLDGGRAARLTTHPGDERHPAVSHDGKLLAFVGNYDGTPEVYTMPVRGGRPVRRTWGAGRGVSVAGFLPDGTLLYASTRASTKPEHQLFALDLASGSARRVPLAQAWQATRASDGALVFTRFRHPQHCKRYRGGTAEQLWRWQDGGEAEPLTSDHAGTSHQPMAWRDRVYFVSDRDGTRNVWSMTPTGGDLEQHTHHVGFDVLGASLSRGRIAYRIGADIRLIDLATGEDRVLPITLQSDFDQARERWIENPMDRLSSAHVSHDGSRVFLTSRGQAFVADAAKKAHPVVTLSRSGDVRYHDAQALGRDGRVLVWSDESGEMELWSLAPTGKPDRRQITKGADVVRWSPHPSPDGKRVAFADKASRLWLADAVTGELTEVESGHRYGDIAWSHDSRWLSYTRRERNGLRTVNLLEAVGARKLRMTSDRHDSSSPAFSRDGRWLYFLSDRHFTSRVSSPWGAHQPEPYFDEKTGVYAIALEAGLRSPFDRGAPPPEAGGRKTKTAARKDDPGKPEPAPLAFPATAGPQHRVPLPPGAYRWLATTEKGLLLTERTGDGTRLLALAHGPEAEPKTVIEEIRSVSLSGDGKKLLVRKGRGLHVVPTPSSKLDAKGLAKGAVDLSRWKLRLDPREDWRGIFVDSWRLHRDYFYDPGMHGVDWKAMRTRYEPLVERVGSRDELNDLIGQMIAELAALHSRAVGGDVRDGPEDIALGSLGAEIRQDHANGVWRIEHVFAGDPERTDARSPLARPDLEIRAGDGIASLDGVPFRSGLEIGSLLLEKAGGRVTLEIVPGGAGREPFTADVDVISARRASGLRYDEWEWTCKQRVEKAGAGRIGYIHLRAMGSRDIGTWVREYSSIVDRQGLVIDVRSNRGGNIDSWILNRLLRRPWMYWKSRGDAPYWNMHRAFRGHMVVLCDHRTASDGEAFAEGFRRLGLGKVIGTRTWGGEIWLSRRNRVVDRGVASAGETGVYGPEGRWLIEGHGVDPDLVVDNLPHATFKGEDAQLAAGIRHLQALIAKDPRPVPTPPAFPDKSSKDNRKRAPGGGR